MRPLYASLIGYGLFAVMTTERRELVIEGSMDGEDLARVRVSPSSLATSTACRAGRRRTNRRLDWQMWFAALTVPERAPWVYNLVFRLLDAEPTVLKWIDDPFAGERPRYVRIVSYRYEFTAPGNPSAKGGGSVPAVGRWWTRSEPRLWLAPMARRVPKVSHDPLELP